MAFTYKSNIGYNIYENINPLAQIKLAWTNEYEDKPIIANYNNKTEYFYAQQIYSDDENFDINEYILSLPVVFIQDLKECLDITEICSNKRNGTIQFYLNQKQFMEDYLSTLPTTTTTTTTTVTSTTVTTTPCPSGVLSQKYYIDATNQCAICVPLNEFVCSPSQNYNYQNCLNSINSYNYGNPNCTTTQSPITSTTVLPTTTEVSTSEMPIGPQG